MYLLDKLTDCVRRECVVVTKDWLELPHSPAAKPNLDSSHALKYCDTTRRNDLVCVSVLM
jgi:hypothetical protein